MGESGAIQEKDKYSELFLRITRISGILTPIAAVLDSLAVLLHIAPPSPAFSPAILIPVLIAFVILGVTQLILKASTPFNLGIYICLYHILAVLLLVFGPGLISPIAFCWIILTLITEIFYGRLYAMLSLAVLSATGLLLYLVEPVSTSLVNLNYPLYLTIIITSSVLIGLLRRVQLVEHQDLKRTQGQEAFQRTQLTALINSLSAAIISTSTKGTVRIYNAALLNLLDTNGSLNGKNIDEALNLYDASGKPVSLVEIASKSQRIIDRDDLIHKFEDGESVRLNISSAPIRGRFSGDGNDQQGYIFIMRDITQQKSLEEERDEFISVVSHELRTPITIAEGTLSNLQFLLDAHKDPTQLSSALKDAHEQIIYLASMVNDLSTLSRAERGVADTAEEVDVRTLLEELYHRYQPKAADKGLALNLEAGHKLGTVTASRLYLEEVLQNFLTNAIKYTQKGSIGLIAHRTAAGVSFAVSDTGIGISKSEQKRVFEKFYRSEDYRTRETSGTGLGLYVVRKLADKLGTTITVESRLNHGSTFGFVLTTAPKAALSSLDETAPSAVHLT